MELKIFVLTRENYGYDEYEGAVVCAHDEADAKTICPDGSEIDHLSEYRGWVKDQAEIKCREIGTANENQTRGVIMASFNAG